MKKITSGIFVGIIGAAYLYHLLAPPRIHWITPHGQDDLNLVVVGGLFGYGISVLMLR